MAATNLQPVITELHKAFNYLNKAYYENKLPEVVIAIRSQGKRAGVMGWFTPAKVWSDGESEKHEIVITAETLNRDGMDIMRTLHHEMVHLYCETNGIKDTSRNGAYHNKNFKEECLKRGFYYDSDKPDGTIGWSMALLTEETKSYIKKWDINFTVFGLARRSMGGKEEKKKKSNRIKWTCPNCGATLSSTKLEGMKPYCMNDNEGKTEPCKTFFDYEIPDNFSGKIPLSDDELAVTEWMYERLCALYEETGDILHTDITEASIEEGLCMEEETVAAVLELLLKKKIAYKGIEGYTLTDYTRELYHMPLLN